MVSEEVGDRRVSRGEGLEVPDDLQSLHPSPVEAGPVEIEEEALEDMLSPGPELHADAHYGYSVIVEQIDVEHEFVPGRRSHFLGCQRQPAVAHWLSRENRSVVDPCTSHRSSPQLGSAILAELGNCDSAIPSPIATVSSPEGRPHKTRQPPRPTLKPITDDR